jgi:tight adherence protein B
MSALVLAIAVFMSIMMVALLVNAVLARRANRVRELLLRGRPADKTDVDSSGQHRPGAISLAQPLEPLLQRFNVMLKVEQNLWQAGLYDVRASEVILVILLLGAAGAGVGLVAFGSFVLALAGAGGLALLPLLYVRLRRHRRVKTFAQQLPEALELMKAALEAGHTLMRAFQVAADELAPPIAIELKMVLEETRLGVSLQRALEDMIIRVPDSNVWFLVVAVALQSRVGSALAEILGRLAETIRARHRVQMQLKALTAQPRLSGFVVGLMPVLIFAAYSVIEPQYSHTLLYDATGRKLLGAAIALDVIAVFAIHRILQIDY